MDREAYLALLKKSIEDIRDYYNKQRLVLFLGAGISKDSGLPGWETVIEEFKKDLGLRSERDFLKIAQLYYLRFGKSRYYEKLFSLFNLTQREPNDLIRKLVSLECDFIVTTNFDDLLEKAVEEKGLFYEVVKEDDDFAKLPYGAKLLIKMHGDLKSHDIVLKEDDYLKYSDNFPLIETFVKSIFINYVVVFIGYSLNDFNVKQIISWIQNRRRTSLPIFFLDVEKNFDCFEFYYFQNKGINVLYLKELDNAILNPSQMVLKFINILLEDWNIESLDCLEFIKVLWETLQPFKDLDYVSGYDLVQIFKERFKLYGVNEIFFLGWGLPYIYLQNRKLISLIQNCKFKKSAFERDRELFDKVKFIFETFRKSNCRGIRNFFNHETIIHFRNF